MELAYQDKTLPVPERVSDLLARMTLEEKAGQLTQLFYFGDGETELTPESAEPDRLNLGIETAVAAGEIGSLLFVCDPEVANKMQRKAVEETRLGIPLIYGFDVIHGFRTIFPVPIALAASWDPTITERTQQVAAAEARAAGIHWTFAPMCDITFDGRWGRVIEGAGEDPLLGAVIAAAAVRGFQGARVAAEIGPESILAGPKHLVGYGASRGGRDYDDAEISETELRNIYLPPFQAAIGAGAANIMAAYMDLNGVPAAGNHWLLTTLLREELGFEGWVVSDNFGVRNLVTQHWAKDFLDAAARALSAGLDMEMTMFDPAFAHLPDAVRAEHVDPGRLDEAVRRVLTAKFGLGLFDAPYVDATVAPAILSSQGHRTLAQEAAEKSLVLLKNGDDLLPLDLNELRSGGPGSVAVIGQLADSKRDTLGPWVFAQDTAETVTLLAALRDRLGAAVSFAPGAQKVSRVYPPPFDDLDPTVLEPAEDWDDDAAIAEAVALASRARLAIMVVGQRQNQVGEKASVSEIDLPGRQLEQLQRVAATGTPVVLVVLCGRPLDLRWADEHIQAIMLSWYPGSRGGGAIARTLFGEVSPAGRLPFSWPRHAGQLPMTYLHNRSCTPDAVGERYWNESSAPLYPFGHGLTYGHAVYHDLSISKPTIKLGETAVVSVAVTNTGDHASDEVVQMYCHQRYGASSRPIRELKGFRRVYLDIGETKTVTFPLGSEQLRYWSAAKRDWVQDATEIDIWLGGSSTADLAATLQVTDAADPRATQIASTTEKADAL